MSEVIYGINPVREVLLHASRRVEKIAIARSRMGPKLREVQQLAADAGIKIEERSRKELDSLSGGGRHQGVVLFAQERRALSLQELVAHMKGLEAPVVLVLDGITDPRNLGALIRSAEVLGSNGVIISRDRSTRLTPAAVKASAGASELMPVATVVNVTQSLKLLKNEGFWVVGTAGDAKRKCFQYDWKGPTAVVLGSEGRGMRRLVREHCDEVVCIPVRGKIASLNVATAAAIIMYEIGKQRGLEKKER